MNDVTAAKPALLCGACGGALAGFHCDACRMTNGPIAGEPGQPMPLAEWCEELNLWPATTVDMDAMMLCAVLEVEGQEPRAFVQIKCDNGRWGHVGAWVPSPSESVNARIFQAWGKAMVARARSAEWVLTETARRRAESCTTTEGQ